MSNRSAFKLDLKLRLTMRVAAIAAVCLFLGAVYAVFDGDRTLWTRAERTAVVAARELQLQEEQSHWLNYSPLRFPDLQAVAEPLAAPGIASRFGPPTARPANASAAARRWKRRPSQTSSRRSVEP